MADIDVHAEWWEKMRTLRNHLAHVPYAARHQREIALPLFQELDAAYQAGTLPADLRDLWAQHRQSLVDAGQAAREFADGWDADFPVLRTRPTE